MPESPYREDRFSEITRRYAEATRNDRTLEWPAITKVMELDSYRQERLFYSKHKPEQAQAATTAQRELPLKTQEAVIATQAAREAAWASASSNNDQDTRREERATVSQTLRA